MDGPVIGIDDITTAAREVLTEVSGDPEWVVRISVRFEGVTESGAQILAFRYPDPIVTEYHVAASVTSEDLRLTMEDFTARVLRPAALLLNRRRQKAA